MFGFKSARLVQFDAKVLHIILLHVTLFLIRFGLESSTEREVAIAVCSFVSCFVLLHSPPGFADG